MVDLGFRSVALGGWGCRGWGGGVEFEGEVEGVGGVGGAGAEGGEDEGGFERGFTGEELVGEVFLGLWGVCEPGVWEWSVVGWDVPLPLFLCRCLSD